MPMTLYIEGVSKSFKKRQILKDITLDAHSGEIIGLVGKSGCGKSTLLKIIVGYYKPDSGRILLNGKNISENIMDLRRKVGYTTQENSFYEKLSIIENMKYYSNLYNLPLKGRNKRIESLLDRVGLLEHKNLLASKISGGMKRRLDFAISLLHNPPILILDEPTAGLDPLLVDQFWKIVKDVVKEEGKIVIMTSHILSEIEKYCTRAVVIDEGVIISEFSGEGIKGLEKKFRGFMKKEKSEDEIKQAGILVTVPSP
ncbi:MAG: ABC transporter ATP-binding protein [Candidatus Woesearchaeota archaeon]|nr:ABC transporter ATP-binding protein [Candidatus Woesearchaeota archaeon]